MLTYRLEKGSPLTLEEMDGNFRELEERLEKLESEPEEQESIGRLFIEGQTLKVLGTQGTELGALPLPTFSFNFQGEWRTGLSYELSAFVTHCGGLYSCVQAHTSCLWEKEEGLWQEIFTPPKNSDCLPLYERATLPQQEKIGKVALLLGEGSSQVIFFNGTHWESLQKGEQL